MLRYGVIGTGSMGREHLSCLATLPGAHIVALADPHPASLTAARALLDEFGRLGAAEHSDVRCYRDYRELVADDRIDAVIIATPNHTHHSILVDALRGPAAILVEKPLCTTEAECRDIVRRCQERSALVWVGQEYRYMPPVAEALRLVRDGGVGRVHQIAIREHREPFYPKVDNWNRFTRNTGGTLVEKCCHYFDLMCLIADSPPVRVFASGGQRVNHLEERYDNETPDILDSAYVVVEFEDGTRGMLDLCMFAESTAERETLTIIGDAGKVESALPSLTVRHGLRSDWAPRTAWGDPPVPPLGVRTRTVWDFGIRYVGHHYGATYLEHVHFAAAVTQGLPPAVSVRDGARAVAIGAAAHRSIETGAPQLCAEVDDAEAGAIFMARS